MSELYEAVTEQDGFKPCPICERYDKVKITSRSHFCESVVEDGYYLVQMECDRCNLNLWSHKCKGKNYGAHREFIKRRWNKLWSREMEGDEDVTLHNGRWFWTDGMYACDQCHAVLDEMSPFCPMCGADMRG